MWCSMQNEREFNHQSQAKCIHVLQISMVSKLCIDSVNILLSELGPLLFAHPLIQILDAFDSAVPVLEEQEAVRVVVVVVKPARFVGDLLRI